MTWIEINNRILALEKLDKMTEEQKDEWKNLVSLKRAGILKRKIDEKIIRKTKREDTGKEENNKNSTFSLFGYMEKKEA